MPNHSHQRDLFDPTKARPVVLIGAGAIGSYIALILAKAGVTDITVYDYDVVASHNVPMSLYRESDIGRYKVEALQDIVWLLTGVTIQTYSITYTSERMRRSSVIMSVDDMDAGRKPVWAQVQRDLSIDIMIDTRLAAGYGEIYSIVPHSADLDEFLQRSSVRWSH